MVLLDLQQRVRRSTPPPTTSHPRLPPYAADWRVLETAGSVSTQQNLQDLRPEWSTGVAIGSRRGVPTTFAQRRMMPRTYTLTWDVASAGKLHAIQHHYDLCHAGLPFVYRPPHSTEEVICIYQSPPQITWQNGQWGAARVTIHEVPTSW